MIAARDATLTFMVGGEEESFVIAESILKFMGKNVVHCGAVGTGQVCSQSRLSAEIYNQGILLSVSFA